MGLNDYDLSSRTSCSGKVGSFVSDRDVLHNLFLHVDLHMVDTKIMLLLFMLVG